MTGETLFVALFAFIAGLALGVLLCLAIISAPYEGTDRGAKENNE